MFGDRLRAGSVWSFSLYGLDEPFNADLRLRNPIKVFNSRQLRLRGPNPHTQADPFLLADGDRLFIFYERVMRRGVGKIACRSTRDLVTFEDHGLVLDCDYHLSWPYVFREGEQIYMVPESRQAGEVALYRFRGLPAPLSKVRTLLTGDFVDPVLIQHLGLWYLFATSASGLHLFVADDLLTGTFRAHPRSPITTDLRFSRSGGAPIATPQGLLRIAQDCSASYGENVSLIRIAELGPTTYREELVRRDFLERRDFWNRDGAHHLSVAQYAGRTIIAVDGRHRDYWINKFVRFPVLPLRQESAATSRAS